MFCRMSSLEALRELVILFNVSLRFSLDASIPDVVVYEQQ